MTRWLGQNLLYEEESTSEGLSAPAYVPQVHQSQHSMRLLLMYCAPEALSSRTTSVACASRLAWILVLTPDMTVAVCQPFRSPTTCNGALTHQHDCVQGHSMQACSSIQYPRYTLCSLQSRVRLYHEAAHIIPYKKASTVCSYFAMCYCLSASCT